MRFVLALAIVLAMDMFLGMGQIAVGKLADNGNATQFYQGNYTIDGTLADQLPDTESSVSASTGNIFTDTYVIARNWLTKKFDQISGGFSYASNVVNAVPNFLRSINLPSEITNLLGWFWHLLTLFLFIMVAMGRY